MIAKVKAAVRHPASFYGVCVILILIFIQFVARLAIVQGPSMEPTLRDGDIVVVWQWGYRPSQGDIVITNSNNPFGVRLVKRVVAVGGETYTPETGLSTEVPDGSVFLVGDNRNHSRDSREAGAIPESEVMGKVVARVWPFGEG